MGVTLLPSGAWRVQVRRRSLKVDQTFPTELEARTFLARYVARINPKADTPLLSNAWDQYEKSLEYANKRPRTRGTEASRIKKWIERLGDTPVGAIQAQHVEDYIARRKRSRPEPSPDAIRLEVAAFSALMRYCAKKRWIPANPCIGVTRPTVTRTPKRISSEERGHLIELLRHKNSRFRFAARLCLLVLETGARPGEWVNARLSDVDFRKDTVVFRSTKHRQQPRTVPLTASASKLLADHVADVAFDRDEKFLASDLLFPAIGRDRKVRPMHYTGALRDAKKKGLVPKSVRAHTGRHEFISLLVESSKLDDSRIMAIVGHHSPASMEIYKHVRNIQFRGDLAEVDSKVLRPQRVQSLAEVLDLPAALIEGLLESRRSRDEEKGLTDPGDELLYSTDVLEKLHHLAGLVSGSPQAKATLLAGMRRAIAARQREREMRDGSKNTAGQTTGEAFDSAQSIEAPVYEPQDVQVTASLGESNALRDGKPTRPRRRKS